MKLLYAARICRFDLLRSINNLARKITKWSVKEDAGLLHLISYVHHTKHHEMIGWVGNSLKDLSIGLFADADCGESLRSTSGAHMHIQGSHTRFPLAKAASATLLQRLKSSPLIMLCLESGYWPLPCGNCCPRRIPILCFMMTIKP